jgi:hypothetical protein
MGEKEYKMSDETKAVLVKVGSRDAWLIEGRLLPYIAGGAPGGDGDSGGDGGGDGNGDSEGDKKIVFTDDQQAHIDKLISNKYADAHTKAEAKAQLAIDALKVELEEIKTTKKPDDKQNKGNEDLTALQEKIAVLEADKIKGFQASSESNIISAASDLKAVNSRQVYDLLKSQIKIADDGTRAVINSEGQPRINADGQPFSEKELVAEFLANNQHFVQASGKTGSGSQQPGFGESGDEDISKLPLVEQLTKVREAKAAKNK